MREPWKLIAGEIALDLETHSVYVRSNDPRRPGYSVHHRGFGGYHEVRVGYGGFMCVKKLVEMNGGTISGDALQVASKGFTTKQGDLYIFNKLRREFERQRTGSSNWFVRHRGARYALILPK